MAAERAPNVCFLLWSAQGSPFWAALVFYAGYVVWWRRAMTLAPMRATDMGNKKIKGD